MEIFKLTLNDKKWLAETSALLMETFEDTFEESWDCSDEKVALVAIEDTTVVGFVGAQPQYGRTGWELHPLAVRKEKRGKGIASALMAALEKEVVARGGVTVYLGSDDEQNQTSLYGEDLYENTYDKIMNIQNKNDHAYEFYQKVGYKIVGVIPDANGIGKPDIWMAKRVRGAL